jgi:hypothetical protein
MDDDRSCKRGREAVLLFSQSWAYYCLGVFLVGGATFFVVLEMNQKRQEQLIQE